MDGLFPFKDLKYLLSKYNSFQIGSLLPYINMLSDYDTVIKCMKLGPNGSVAKISFII